MNTSYNPRTLATDIKRYYEHNPEAGSVLIFKGTRKIFVNREFIDKHFNKTFLRIWSRSK